MILTCEACRRGDCVAGTITRETRRRELELMKEQLGSLIDGITVRHECSAIQGDLVYIIRRD